MDKRIGKEFLEVGLGYGGICFPKDVKALVSIGELVGYEMLLVEATIQVNEKQKDFVEA